MRIDARILLALLALLPLAAQAQADKKLIDKAEKGDTKAMVLLGRCYQNGAGVPLDSAAALQWFQKAADLGDGTAWCYISKLHIEGSALAKDTARYFAIRQEWADKGCPDAIAALGTAYLCGYGTAPDTAKAIELFQTATKKGSAWGCFGLGRMYLGLDGKKYADEKKGLSLMLKAAKLGDLDAIEMLADLYRLRKDYKKAWQWAEEGMKWGMPYATADAALMLYFGEGKATDEAKAQQMMEMLIDKFPHEDFCFELAGTFFMFTDDPALRDSAKAAAIWKAGDAFGGPRCQLRLGDECLRQGLRDEALGYYAKAAEKESDDWHNGQACLNVGEICLGDADTAQAIRWLRRGADKFEAAQCANRLASIYYTEGSHYNPAEVERYLLMSDRLGDTAALNSLFYLYSESGNSEKAAHTAQTLIDRKRSPGHYLMSTLLWEQGDTAGSTKELEAGAKEKCPFACLLLGKIHQNGAIGGDTNIEKAVGYYRLSNLSEAKYLLANIYLDNELGCKKAKEIAKNEAAGLALLKEAATEGYIDAIYRLGGCYETGSHVDSIDHARALSLYRLLSDNGVAAGDFKVGLYYELGDGGLRSDTAEAIRYYEKAAAQGIGMASCYLGDFYKDGAYLAKDEQRALELFTQAHQQGEAAGTARIGLLRLQQGDTLAALPYLRLAAAHGIGEAAYPVATFYEKGLAGLEANGDSAVAYYLAAYRGGSAPAGVWLGRQLIKEESYEQAAACFATAAQRGSAEGMAGYAVCLKEGLGVAQADPEEAYRLFEQSVRQEKIGQSYYNMGIARINGDGCPEDLNLGRAYLDTAANLGFTAAMVGLGACLLDGTGCLADTAQAIVWLERAADNGNINAVNLLGSVYQEKGDFKNAALYYEKAVAAGSLRGYCRLAYCYEEGLGVVLNSKKALDLYTIAAEHGSAEGMMSTAACYANGVGTEPDLTAAAKWFEQAAEAGEPKAMYYLGTLYENGGEGFAADLKKAKEWYKKAAALDYTPAAVALGRL